MFFVKTLWYQPFRYVLTSIGIALCLVLMLFMLGIYRGVSAGSVEFIRTSKADLWILQEQSNNILRTVSLLRLASREKVESIDGVRSVSPMIFLLGSVKDLNGNQYTVYLTGSDPDMEGGGGPTEIFRGRNLERDREIVLDRAFAAKYDLAIGDQLILRKDTVKVVGLSDKSNMIVIQYAFVSLNQAYTYLGVPGIVSCYQVRLDDVQQRSYVKEQIQSLLPNAVVFDQETFLQNNVKEMQSGLLPLLFLLSAIGAIVLTAVLSLIMAIMVLERRKEYAIMKALGAPQILILKLVLKQSTVQALSGLVLAVLMLWPVLKLVETITPEMSIRISAMHLLVTSLFLMVISLLASIFPIEKLRKIYPLELFQS